MSRHLPTTAFVCLFDFAPKPGEGEKVCAFSPENSVPLGAPTGRLTHHPDAPRRQSDTIWVSIRQGGLNLFTSNIRSVHLTPNHTEPTFHCSAGTVTASKVVEHYARLLLFKSDCIILKQPGKPGVLFFKATTPVCTRYHFHRTFWKWFRCNSRGLTIWVMAWCGAMIFHD